MKKTQSPLHGGDWAGFEIEYGKEPLDFSMNVNPLGFPESAAEAIVDVLRKQDRYPDPLSRNLKKAISDKEGVAADWIFIGNGASDIIFRSASVFWPEGTDAAPTLLVTAPTFSEYETSYREYGWNVKEYELSENKGFRIDEDILDMIDMEDVDCVILCEPNNPTGVLTDGNLLEKIAHKCHENGIILLVDECFLEFRRDAEDRSMKRFLSEMKNLMVLKAFTKVNGMAGLRLGYCLCSDIEIIDKLEKAGPLWNVSGVAQAAGTKVLSDAEYIEKGISIIEEERPYIAECLKSLGIEKVYGEGNYLLFRSVPTLDRELRRKGILIRNCDNYSGLGPGWFRVAVRKHEENVVLLKAIEEVLV